MTRHLVGASFEHGRRSYEICPEGVVFRVAGRDDVFGHWERITQINDRSDNGIELAMDQGASIPVSYEMPAFPDLVEALSTGMATVRKGRFRHRTFLVAPFFLLCCLFAILFGSSLILFELLADDSAGYVAVALLLPVGFMMAFQTMGVSLGVKQMKVLKPFNSRTISYSDIRQVDISLRKKRYASSLVVTVHHASGKQVELQSLKKMGLFAFLLKQRLATAY